MPDNTEEQFMQRRLLVASVLSAVAIMGYVYVASLNAPPAPPSPPSAIEQTVEEPSTPDTAASESGQAAEGTEPNPAAAPAGDAAIVAAQAEEEVVVETATYRVVLSNRGAAAKNWVLKEYEDSHQQPLDVVHHAGAEKYGEPFTLLLPGGDPLEHLNDALFTVSREGTPASGETVTFEYAGGEWSSRKTFRFQPQGYVLEVETEVRRNDEPVAHLVAWPGGFGDTAHPSDALYSQTFYFDSAGSAVVRHKASAAEEERISNTGPYAFAGIDDLFFAAAFTPKDAEQVTLETWAVHIVPEPEAEEAVFAAAAVGGAGSNHFEVFLGPKSIPLLYSVSPRLRDIVDFGWFGFLSVPLFYLLIWTHDNIVANYGWAIVVMTVFINFVLFPLKWKSTKSMKKMQALQPLIKQLNDKYKGLSIKDPKKAQQNEEMMALYKKHGVNPLGGCLPMLLQFPFLVAFYYMLSSAIELRQAGWLWVDDLSRPEQLAIRVLPLAMIATQFWQQSMTPQPTVDPAQARMMKFMPLLFGFLFYGFQSGLVLYWLATNLVGVGQQALLNRFPAEPIEIEQPRRRKRKN